MGVALGGAFARGVAQIGVLQAFEEHGIPVDFIAGTSVGALVAAAYASGTSLAEMERQAAATRFRDFGRWTISKMGLASNERLENFLGRFSSARHFREMKPPLAIVATDLLTGKSVHFTEGEIGPRSRVSCAYPGLFLPIEYRGHCLVDGFLTETAPSTAVREMGAKVVIAVHLDPRLPPGKPGSALEVINRSFAIIQTSASQPWRDATDVLIEPNVRDIFWDDFAKTPQLVSAGGNAANAVLPRIRAALVRRVPRPLRVRTRSHIPEL